MRTLTLGLLQHHNTFTSKYSEVFHLATCRKVQQPQPNPSSTRPAQCPPPVARRLASLLRGCLAPTTKRASALLLTQAPAVGSKSRTPQECQPGQHEKGEAESRKQSNPCCRRQRLYCELQRHGYTRCCCLQRETKTGGCRDRKRYICKYVQHLSAT